MRFYLGRPLGVRWAPPGRSLEDVWVADIDQGLFGLAAEHNSIDAANLTVAVDRRRRHVLLSRSYRLMSKAL